MLDEYIEAGCQLDFHCVGLLLPQLLDQVFDQVVLDLEQVRWINLDDVLKGLVGHCSHIFVRTLIVKFRVGIK